jgi:methylamine---glutamate N-methyltransferase subunit C
MEQPIVAGNKPIKTSLKEGVVYHYCTCGRSKKQVFCDGSHTETGMYPMRFVTRATTDKWLCACKQTKNPPYCDGSHQHVSDDQIGQIID